LARRKNNNVQKRLKWKITAIIRSGKRSKTVKNGFRGSLLFTADMRGKTPGFIIGFVRWPNMKNRSLHVLIIADDSTGSKFIEMAFISPAIDAVTVYSSKLCGSISTKKSL
jgi:hypothetical protein